MERLEAIVEAMDSPTLPLEQLVARYEEGIALVKVCEEKLRDAEQKIEIITRRAQGKPKLEPFEAEAKPQETARGNEVNLF